MVASLRNIDDIIEVASQNFNARKLSDFLSTRFGLDVDTVKKSVLEKYNYKHDTIVSPYFEFGKLIGFLKDIHHTILSNAKNERESYIDYLRETGFENDCLNGGATVVDIGYSGSMQYYL
ncbi:hypothetical protein QUG09_26315, partial [Escherichia coli]|nr:hypothetical protein [Escherichia coli]